MIGHGPSFRPFLEAALGCAIPEPAEFIAKVVDGKPASIAAFASWFGHDAEIFMWSAGTMHRDFLKALGRYAFDVLGCKRITCRVAADNPWAKTLVRLGFVQEGCLRGGYDGQIDLLIFGVLREEYRFHGWQKST